MEAGSPSQHDADHSDPARGLIMAAGLTLSDDEQRRLSALHRRFAPARATLAAVELGETEPLVTVASPHELRDRR